MYAFALIVADWLWSHAQAIAACLFFGGIYLFWVCRERRHIKAVRRGKPVDLYVAGGKAAHAHPKPVTGRLSWYWRTRLRG